MVAELIHDVYAGQWRILRLPKDICLKFRRRPASPATPSIPNCTPSPRPPRPLPTLPLHGAYIASSSMPSPLSIRIRYHSQWRGPGRRHIRASHTLQRALLGDRRDSNGDRSANTVGTRCVNHCISLPLFDSRIIRSSLAAVARLCAHRKSASQCSVAPAPFLFFSTQVLKSGLGCASLLGQEQAKSSLTICSRSPTRSGDDTIRRVLSLRSASVGMGLL